VAALTGGNVRANRESVEQILAKPSKAADVTGGCDDPRDLRVARIF
jgi:hypothetical protein